MSLDYGSRTCRDCDLKQAEIDRLRAELDERNERSLGIEFDLADVRARLAAVVALCDQSDEAERGKAVRYHGLFVEAVRAAATGNQS